MSRIASVLGLRSSSETAPGVHEQAITEYRITAEVISNRLIIGTQEPQGDLTASVVLRSIFVLPVGYEVSDIAYATYEMCKWEVTGIQKFEKAYSLTLGGLYHGE